MNGLEIYPTKVNDVVLEVLQTVFFPRWKSVEPSDSKVLACKTDRVSFKVNKLCNYRLKLPLGIERLRLKLHGGTLKNT